MPHYLAIYNYMSRLDFKKKKIITGPSGTPVVTLLFSNKSLILSLPWPLSPIIDLLLFLFSMTVYEMFMKIYELVVMDFVKKPPELVVQLYCIFLS